MVLGPDAVIISQTMLFVLHETSDGCVLLAFFRYRNANRVLNLRDPFVPTFAKLVTSNVLRTGTIDEAGVHESARPGRRTQHFRLRDDLFPRPGES